ncbi:hypothetical protein J2W35_003716 [Variovorax boronicumulans]|uniref:hypothetical protein n=1 Tax=Variovorax boronicumulans TaxID=436515 RepID=UPI00278B676A|nr:hypothetical protein [Variovorax boronicumulans]MDQ0083352.1 hypothetical protein [Variovorax boronicumulans]
MSNVPHSASQSIGKPSKPVFMCVKCKFKPADMKSHVVPKSIRNRLFGEHRSKGTRFAFEYAGRKDLPKQDFPKPELMCASCDNGLGGMLEKDIPKLLMPKDLGSWEQWVRLGLKPASLGVYHLFDYRGSAAFTQIERVAALTAWRAMHAMARDGSAILDGLLTSPAGMDLDRAMIAYIENGTPLGGVALSKPSLWWLSAQQIIDVTGEDDRLPISWGALGTLGTPGDVTLAVLFGFWLVTWNLPGAASPTDQLVYHWFNQMKEEHRQLVAGRKC